MHPIAAKALFKEHTKHLSLSLAQRRGWVIHSLEFPEIDIMFTASERTVIRLLFICDDWNDLPPSISLLTAEGTLIETKSTAIQSLPRKPAGIFNRAPHDTTQRPFICMRGSREFHTHPVHVNDSWEKLKNSPNYTLGNIITQLWHAWLKGES